MISLVETGLMNALLAVLLALPVLALGRIWQRPALIHAFWILVLVKLIAPPLYLIPVRLSLPARPSTELVNRVTPTTTPPAHVQLGHLAGPIEAVATSHSLSRPSQFAVRRTEILSAAAGLPAHSWTQYCEDLAATALRFLQRLALPILGLWFCGSMCWFGWQGWRVVRFTQVFLKYARRGPLILQQLAQRLARPMGITQTPEVWLLPAVVSPMLWSVGGKPRILFPTDLLSRLDEGAVATLLTHELAHYRRGDHRVRLLEFLASGLFWWHPVIWLARRELEISEEKCCDAWVVSQFPEAQRQYADALLATVDFLTEDHPTLPATACGLGEVPLLRQRLRLIMCGTAPKSLSLLGRAAVVATAMLIPISPSLRLREQAPVVEAAVKSTAETQQPRSAGPRIAPSKSPAIPDTPRSATNPSSPLGGVKPALPPASSVVVASAPGCDLISHEASPGNEPVSSPSTSPPDSSPLVTTSQFIRQVLGQPPERESSSTLDLQDLFDFATCHAQSVLFVAEGKVSLTGSRDGSIRVWNLQQAPATERAGCGTRSGESTCETVRNSVDAMNDDIAAMWDVDQQHSIEPATMSPRRVSSLSISPQSLTLAANFGWLSPDLAPAVLRFTADGKLLVATEWNGTLVTWDLGTQVRISK